jgi:hypothetical protein
MEGLGDPRKRLGDPRERLGDPMEGLGDPRECQGDPREGLGIKEKCTAISTAQWPISTPLKGKITRGPMYSYFACTVAHQHTP